MPSINQESGEKPRSIAFYVFLGAALFAFIQSYSLLSPILLSFLLVILISLAVNPLILWIRSLTGGRKLPAGLVVVGFVAVLVLTGWAFFEPMRDTVVNLSVQLPIYWERLQKPLIRMEQEAALTEEKLQAEVRTERARTEMAEGDTVVAQKITESTQPASPGDDGSLRSGMSDMFQGVLGSFTAVAFNGTQMLIVMVTVFFGVTFTLMNPRPIIGAMFSLVPERHHDQALINGARYEAASGYGDIFDALMCGGLWSDGCFGGITTGRHFPYPARRVLSKALSSRGNGCRPGSSGRNRATRKAVRWQVTRVHCVPGAYPTNGEGKNGCLLPITRRVSRQGRSWQSRRGPAKSADDHFVERISHRR
jgi:hypothetical protein